MANKEMKTLTLDGATYEIVDEAARASIGKLSEGIEAITALPYGGSKEWLEANGDKTQLYQIDGYVWGYVESDGWTKSGTQFLVVSSESQMTNVGGTEYLLRDGSEGTVYTYAEASGDTETPVYDSLPETANDGDIVAVGGRKYKASVTTIEVPDYTRNYADPTSSDWGIDKRLGSDGGFRDQAGSHTTNYVLFSKGDIVRVQGMDLTVYNSAVYASSGVISSSAKFSTQTAYFSDISATTNGGQGTATVPGYVRFSGPPTGTANDIIITINEEITTKTENTISWTDIGEYIAPVEAGWNATDETYTVIDSLSISANSGDSAVFSGDGYVYTYIGGADWMQMSKYNAPTLTIDAELSDSSKNAVQNKVVAAAFNAVNEKTKDIEADIITLQNEVEALGGGTSTSTTITIPSYWETAVAEKTETIKSLQTAGGKNCVGFAHCADLHIPDNDKGRTNDIGKVMAKMMDNCELPFAVADGDIGTRASYSTETDFVATQKQIPIHLAPLWNTDRFLMSLGNHDGCYGDSTGYYRKQFPPERMWQTYFRGQALDFRRVFSDDGLYFFVDNVSQKTRFILLNSNFGGKYAENENGWAVNNRFATSSYGQEQLNWLANAALDMPDGYGAVICAHVPPNITYTVDKELFIGIVDAYNNKTTFSGSYTAGVDGWTNSSVNVDFTNAKGEVIAMFAGHVHWDKVDTTTMSCPIITIMAAGASVNEHNMEEGEVAPTRTFGTDTETSFDVVTINRATRKIYCTRVGAGNDREISY